jgi:DNA-binding LytR/AlgR family response regulator
MIPINGNDIAFFFIENDSVFAFTFEQKKYLVNQKLESLEKIFPDYFRANRQFLVNRKAVKDASYYFNRKLVVNLNIPFKEQIIIGKLKTTDFIQWLTNS